MLHQCRHVFDIETVMLSRVYDVLLSVTSACSNNRFDCLFLQHVLIRVQVYSSALKLPARLKVDRVNIAHTLMSRQRQKDNDFGDSTSV